MYHLLSCGYIYGGLCGFNSAYQGKCSASDEMPTQTYRQENLLPAVELLAAAFAVQQQ